LSSSYETFNLAHQPAQDNNIENPSSHTHSNPDPLQEIRTNFDVLKAQYSALIKVLQTPLNDTPQQILSPLPSTFEEEEEKVVMHTQRVNTPVTRKSLRDSISDSFVEWFDAEDEGPQEFIMDVGQDAFDPPSRMHSVTNDISADNSSIDTDYEEATTTSVSVTHGESTSFGQMQVVRRTQLPALPPADEGSLFAILKKNVGKVCILIFSKITNL
jgi:hypothetical protein